jgi:hypothetical protein
VQGEHRGRFTPSRRVGRRSMVHHWEPFGVEYFTVFWCVNCGCPHVSYEDGLEKTKDPGVDAPQVLLDKPITAMIGEPYEGNSI